MSLPPPPLRLRGRRSPPALVDDAVREIFLRFPPDDTKSLVRASAVCKNWRGILSDDDFERLYRAFHGTPPLLGFLHNKGFHPKQPYGARSSVSQFVSTSPSCPLAFEDRRYWHVLGSRHGLVLFYTPKEHADFAICNLVTNSEWAIQADHKFSDIIRSNKSKHWNAAVLCAKDRCDHLDCHGGPFLVAFVGSNLKRGFTVASVYSSDTGKWSDMISVKQPESIEVTGHSAVVGNKVYFPCNRGFKIMEYNLGEQELSVICLPCWPIAEVLVGVDDEMLLFARVVKDKLYLCSMEASPNGAKAWARRRVIKLEPLLHPDALLDMKVVGFAESVCVIFLSTACGLYTIELSSGEIKYLNREKVFTINGLCPIEICSGEIKKVHEKANFTKVIPYTSFYTEAWGRSRTADEASHAVVGSTTILTKQCRDDGSVYFWCPVRI